MQQAKASPAINKQVLICGREVHERKMEKERGFPIANGNADAGLLDRGWGL